MAAQNHSAGVTSQSLPLVLHSLGVSLPPGSTTAAPAPSVVPDSNTAGAFVQQIQVAITAAFSSHDAANSAATQSSPAFPQGKCSSSPLEAPPCR